MVHDRLLDGRQDVADFLLPFGILDEELIQQAALRVELLQSALDDLVLDGGRLPLHVGQGAQNLLFPIKDVARHLIAPDEGRRRRADLERQILPQLVQLLAPCHPLRSAPDAHQDADLPAGVQKHLDGKPPRKVSRW